MIKVLLKDANGKTAIVELIGDPLTGETFSISKADVEAAGPLDNPATEIGRAKALTRSMLLL